MLFSAEKFHSDVNAASMTCDELRELVDAFEDDLCLYRDILAHPFSQRKRYEEEGDALAQRLTDKPLAFLAAVAEFAELDVQSALNAIYDRSAANYDERVAGFVERAERSLNDLNVAIGYTKRAIQRRMNREVLANC